MRLNPATKTDYDILTALRGPDSDTYAAAYAKTMLTAVLRYFAGMPALPAGYYNGANVLTPDRARQSWASLPEATKNSVREFLSSDFHYTSHMRRAFTALDRKLRTLKAPIAARRSLTAYITFLHNEKLL